MSETNPSLPTPSLESLQTREWTQENAPQKSIEEIITSTGCDKSILEDYSDELQTISSSPIGKEEFENAIKQELEKQSPPLPNKLIENIISKVWLLLKNTWTKEVVKQTGKVVEQTGKVVEQKWEITDKWDEWFEKRLQSVEKNISTISDKLGKENPIIQEADKDAESIITSGKADTPELQNFLEKSGVTDKEGNIPPDKKESFARIVRAHVSTRTFINHRSELEATKDPDIQKAMKNIVAEAPWIGVTLRGSYPNDFSRLTSDQPRAEREKLEQAARVISGGKDIPVSREGNMIHFHNPDKPSESTHTIDLNKKPPELIKKEGILESKRTLAEKPDTKMAEEREKREQEYKKIEIAGETLKQKSESLTPITEGATEDDTKKLGEISHDALRTTSKEIATETKKRPLDRAKIATLLQTQKEQVSNLRTKYDDYIAEGKERDFPEWLEEENRRRTLIDTTLHTLEWIEKTGESLWTSLESLPPEKKEEKDEAQKANEAFETVSNHNLSMLRDLGFDKWDSMDDVTAFIDYADGKSRSNSGQEFPRNENGEINLGARKIGEEGKYLIDSLHTLLGSNQKQENPESSKNVIEKYRDIRSDLALGSRGQILTNYHLLKLDHGGELSRSILESRTKAPAETGKPAPTQTPETPPQ